MKRKCNWCGSITNNWIQTPLGVCCDECHTNILKRALAKDGDNKEGESNQKSKI